MTAYGGSQAIDWVMDCVRLIHETAASAPHGVADDSGQLQEDPSGDAAEFMTLISEPNPYMDYSDLMSVSIIDLLLAGEFFWHKHRLIGDSGRPLAIYRLSPAHIEIIPGESKMIQEYVYKLPGKKPVHLKPDEVIHAKLPNPHDPYRGLSVIAGGPRVYDVELSMTEAQAQFFEQGTKLSGVLQTDRRVPEPVFKKIQRQFRSMYSGAQNAYKVAVLEAGLKFTPVQPTAAEAQFEELSKLSRDRIAHMFRVPLPLIGNLENANYKMSEAQRIFDTKTMRPLLDRIENVVTRGLGDAYGVEFKIDYQYVMPDEDRYKLAESFASLPGVKVREVREVVGLEPLGDKRDEIVLNLPTDDAPTRPRGSEPGRPPNGENAPAFPAPGEREPRPRTPAFTGGKRGDAKAMFQPENPDPLKDARDTVVDTYAHRMRSAIEVAATALEVELTAELRGDRKAKADSLNMKLKKSSAWKRFEEAVKNAMEKNAREALQQSIDQHKLLGFEPVEFDIDEVARELVNRENGIKSIVGNFKQKVADVVREGVKRGYNPDQILHGTADEYTGLRGTMVAWRRNQAETIALTESAEYYNEGVLRVAEHSGHSFVLVLDGEDFDEPCRAANGEVWAVSHARRRRTEHPRCRRSFFPLGVEGEIPTPGPRSTLGSGVKAQIDLPPQEIQIDLQQPPPPEVKVNVNPPNVTVLQPEAEPVLPPDVNVMVPKTETVTAWEIERDADGRVVKMIPSYASDS